MKGSWIKSEEPEGSWAEAYYEALQFYYHEPKHLRKRDQSKLGPGNSESVDQYLRGIEVSLNHLIRQCLSLAPNSLRKRIFNAVAFDPAPRQPVSGRFVMAGRQVTVAERRGDGEHVYASNTQPDLLFKGSGETVSLEMKIGSKSEVNQVLKYALFALALELDAQASAGMQHFLMFLAEGHFSQLWKAREPFTSVEELRIELERRMDAFLEKRARFYPHKDRFFEIVRALSIGFLSYKDLARVLEGEKDELDNSPNAEVYRNLLDGMIGELKNRALI